MNDRDQSQDKKTQILEAAASVLSSRGIQGFSFENVANETGLSRQLVRYYYTDLETLIADLCDHLAGTYRERLLAGIVDVGEVGRLKFFLDFFFGLDEEHPMPGNLEAYDGMVAYSVGSEAVRDHMCNRYETLGEVIMHELVIAYPELSEASCKELSFMFVSMMHAHWSFVASLGYCRQHGLLARKAFDCLIASYVGDSPTAPLIEKAWSREK